MNIKDKENKITISANEINKYLYCNYQWYYEKTYGQPTLRKLNKEFLQSLGIQHQNNDEENFAKGKNYHNKFIRSSIKKGVVNFIILVIIIVILYLFIYFGIFL